MSKSLSQEILTHSVSVGFLVQLPTLRKCKDYYLGGGDKRIVVRGKLGKKLARPYLKEQAWPSGTFCNPSYAGSIGRKIAL
jgi:hypothetical protein